MGLLTYRSADKGNWINSSHKDNPYLQLDPENNKISSYIMV